jgi:hypothetical protein
VRTLLIVALGSLWAASVSAQSGTNLSEAPGVVVTRISWQKETYIPALYEDPMVINLQQSQLMREQRLARERDLRAKNAEAPSSLPTRSRSKTVGTVNYVVRARIKNTGDKTIREIGWEYLLFDPTTEIELGRYFHSMKIHLGIGKTRNLTARSTRPPAGILQVSIDGKEAGAKYSERVIINRIKYADGSVWQRSLN